MTRLVLDGLLLVAAALLALVGAVVALILGED